MDGRHSEGILPAASTVLGPDSSAEAPWTTSGLLYVPSKPGILSLQYSQIDQDLRAKPHTFSSPQNASHCSLSCMIDPVPADLGLQMLAAFPPGQRLCTHLHLLDSGPSSIGAGLGPYQGAELFPWWPQAPSYTFNYSTRIFVHCLCHLLLK